MSDRRVILVRELATSDLGWFAAKRPDIRSKQRAININATVMARLLDNPESLTEALTLTATCTHPRAAHVADRSLGRVHKNWRLGGRQVQGNVFAQASEGDLFMAEFTIEGGRPTSLRWTVVMGDSDPAAFARAGRLVRAAMQDHMALFEADSAEYQALRTFVTEGPVEASSAAPAQPSAARRPPPLRTPSRDDELRAIHELLAHLDVARLREVRALLEETNRSGDGH